MKQFPEIFENYCLETDINQRIENLPLGQKILRLGLKPTSDGELREWFKCDEIQRRAVKEENRSEIQKKWDERHTRREEARVRREKESTRKAEKALWESLVEKYGEKKAYKKKPEFKEYEPNDMYRMQSYLGTLPINFGLPDLMLDLYRTTCQVKYEKLDHYQKDVIPDYVLDHLEEAKLFGFQDFEVAYPELKKEKMPDPVLLGVCGDQKYFLSFWE